MLILVLSIDCLAVMVTAAMSTTVGITVEDLGRFAILAACALVAVELTRHLERRRSFEHISTAPLVDGSAVWGVPALIILPPALASAMVIFLYGLRWIRVRRGQAVVYRWTYSAATVLLGTQVAIAILSAGMHEYPGVPSGPTDLAVVAAAVILRWGVNTALVMAAMAVFDPQASAGDLVGGFNELMLDAGTNALGLIAAVILVQTPWMMLMVVITIAALNRGHLAAHYENQARLDSKTGLATAARWHEYADAMLTRARREASRVGLLMVDLDHFKAINDTHGHLFGDEVLRAVGDELRSEIREVDACGRWGGEEFAIVLSDVSTEEELARVADRIRLRVQSVVLSLPEGNDPGDTVTITASVGGVLYTPDDATTVDDLILAADVELYNAKGSGRNAVRVSRMSFGERAQRPRSAERKPKIDRPDAGPNS